MTVRLSVAIMGHPSRMEMIADLRERLDRPAELILDRHQDRWDTGRRAQLAFDPKATHHLVVQDDAVVCRDLCAGLERAIAATPGDVALSCYIGRVRPYATRIARAVEQASIDVSWITMRDLHWGVAVVLPTPIIERLIRAQDRATSILEYDRRMSRWLVKHGIDVWYTWPSLVDHRDSVSLVGHGDGRHAHEFLGADRSALDVDWSGGFVRVPDPRQAAQMQWPRRVSRRPVVARRAARPSESPAAPAPVE